MSVLSTARPDGTPSRLDWVDVAKGVCIILVVMMHSTHGVEKATGVTTAWAAIVSWCQPFRLPDFFLISGLFVATQIKAPWTTYLDKKVLHLGYFYVLWLHILLATKSAGLISTHGMAGFIELYLKSYVVPFGPIWFLYLLVVLFVTTKALSKLPMLPVLLLTIALNVAVPDTGVFLFDEFKSKLVFFFAGYALANVVFAFADEVRLAPLPLVIAFLTLWAAVNTLAVSTGWSLVPGIALFVSFAGIGGVIAASVVLGRLNLGRFFAFCGRNSIKIYVAFTLFMGPARVILLRLAPNLSADAVVLASIVAGIGGALVLARLVEGTPLDLLFRLPRRTASVPKARVTAVLSRS